jgi:hypothetical protein
MSLVLDLNKSAEKLRLDLTKAAGGTLPEADVGFDLDVSGSYEGLHRSGVTSLLMSRMIPFCMVFDPDKKLDVWTFSDGPAHYVGAITPDDHKDFVRRKVIEKVPNWCGRTDYAPVLKANVKHFGWGKSQGGFLGFGAKPIAGKKSLVLFNTDGASDDPEETDELMKEMQDKGYQVYVQFIAIKQPSANFSFIERLADDYSNCGLIVIDDINKWVALDDDSLNAQFLTDELVDWMKA